MQNIHNSRSVTLTLYAGQYFIPTLREDPADGVVSHKLLLRAELFGNCPLVSIRIYRWVNASPEGDADPTRRDERHRGQNFLPALHPAEIWQESGRWRSNRRRHVFLQRSEGRRHVSWHDSRRSVHEHRT